MPLDIYLFQVINMELESSIPSDAYFLLHYFSILKPIVQSRGRARFLFF